MADDDQTQDDIQDATDDSQGGLRSYADPPDRGAGVPFFEPHALRPFIKLHDSPDQPEQAAPEKVVGKGLPDGDKGELSSYANPPGEKGVTPDENGNFNNPTATNQRFGLGTETNPRPTRGVLQDYFTRSAKMDQQLYDEWASRIDPKKQMGDADRYNAVIHAQTDPDQKVAALQYGADQADKAVALARHAGDAGHFDKMAVLLNHAFNYMPAAYGTKFDPTHQGLVVNTPGSEGPTVLELEQAVNAAHGGAFDYDNVMKNGLTASLQKAQQQADLRRQAITGGGFAPSGQQGAVGPQGPGSNDPTGVRTEVQDQDRPYTGTNPQTDYGPDAGYSYPANPQSGSQAGGTEKPIEGVTVRQDSLRQQGIVQDKNGEYYREIPRSELSNGLEGSRGSPIYAAGKYWHPLNAEELAKITPPRPGGDQAPTSSDRQPMGQPLPAGRAQQNPAQQGAQQFQSQLPGKQTFSYPGGLTQYGRDQAQNPRGRGTFIPDQKNPGHGAWTGGESAAFPPQSSGAQNTASQPRPGSVGPGDEVEYMGQKMTHAQAREQSEKFAAEHPQQPGWAASGTPVAAPQRNDRGKVVQQKGGVSGGGGGRTPAAQHTAEIQNQITDRTELANVYKEASHARANDRELTPIQKEVLDYYENNVMAKHRPQPQYTAQDTGIPSEAVEMLRKNPRTAAQFDKIFGPGASRRVLGQ